MHMGLEGTDLEVVAYVNAAVNQVILMRPVLRDLKRANVQELLAGNAGAAACASVDLADQKAAQTSRRKASSTEVIGRSHKAAAHVPAIALFGQARQNVQIGARVSKTQRQYTLQDPDVDELFTLAPRILNRLSALPRPRLGRGAEHQSTKEGRREVCIGEDDTAAAANGSPSPSSRAP
jgi:multidrug efflux pump subunit AcrB